MGLYSPAILFYKNGFSIRVLDVTAKPFFMYNRIRIVVFSVLTIWYGHLSAQDMKFIDDYPGKSFEHTPRGEKQELKPGVHPPYRSYDGTNNNTSSFSRMEWGATDVPLLRELPAQYGSVDPYNAMGGEDRPSAREISNALCDEPVTIFNSRNLSAFVYVWGQFLDHDISLTPTGDSEYVPITLPDDEPLFTEDIPFLRSEVYPGTGDTCEREQYNLVTAWIDASMVYGSDSMRAAWLRTFHDGKLKTSAGDLLPWNTISGEESDVIDMNAPSMANDSDHTVKTFVAGDVRAAEHPGLTSLHTLFVREHNRICDMYVALGLTDDETIYQLARKAVGAIIQCITYREFLPALGVSLTDYSGYNKEARPDLNNTFATAGYRLGHTMVADEIALRDNNCEPVDPGELDLVDVFFQPQLLVDFGIDPFLRGFASHKQYETDTKINSVLRNFLFGGGFGIDLASINIQRGRDHGLPDYNAVRQYYTGASVTSFSQITSDTAKATVLVNLYGDVNDIDLWVGILAEDRMPGKSVGTTIHAMLASQFQKLRDGDFYFYAYDPYLPNGLRNMVKESKFSDVIKRNTSVTNLQKNVFFTVPCPGEDGEGKEVASTDLIGDAGTFAAYPNPVKDILLIDPGGIEQRCVIRLMTTSGTILKTIKAVSTDQIQMDVRDLAAGVYILQVIGDTTTHSFRIIKMQE